MTQQKLIVGNWKMNGLSAQLSDIEVIAKAAASGVASGVECVLCPPATLLGTCISRFGDQDIAFGGQDCHAMRAGAHTGDVSAPMLADLGARYVIVGHSERRTNYGETSIMVCAKAQCAIESNLTPIVCVGETWEQRDAGEALEIVMDQVRHSLPTHAEAGRICVAYEPVWAIGTGRVPTNDDISEMHANIRSTLNDMFAGEARNIKILYGGSVNGANAAGILAIDHVNGALVGGASLKAETFLPILIAARTCVGAG